MINRLALISLCLASFGWLLFWAVFHTVPGQDWIVFHTAANLAYAHNFTTLRDPAGFTAIMNATHTAWFAQKITVLHPWVYPPVTLLLAAAFGWLSYPVSLISFLLITAAALIVTLWHLEPHPKSLHFLILGVLLSPATAYMIGSGQLSFLIAAIVLLAMQWLPKRPFWAGVAFSALCLKPQFVPLIPIALLAGRHWRAIAGALCGGLALCALSLVAFGENIWIDWIRFASGTDPTLGNMIAVVRTYDQSIHTCLTFFGLTENAASIGQIIATTLAAIAVALAFVRPYPQRTRLIILLCAMVFGAPHVGDYDQILVVIAALLTWITAHHQKSPNDIAPLAAAAWLAPALNPPALIAFIGWPPLTLISAATSLLPIALAAAALLPPKGALRKT